MCVYKLNNILAQNDFRHCGQTSVPAFIKFFYTKLRYSCMCFFIFQYPIQNICYLTCIFCLQINTKDAVCGSLISGLCCLTIRALPTRTLFSRSIIPSLKRRSFKRSCIAKAILPARTLFLAHHREEISQARKRYKELLAHENSNCFPPSAPVLLLLRYPAALHLPLFPYFDLSLFHYTAIPRAWKQRVLWADFLPYGYTDKPFENRMTV